MKKDLKKMSFNNWIFGNAYPNLHNETREMTLNALIRCMWAINRNTKWNISITPSQASIWHNDIYLHLELPKDFKFKDYNHSEQEALTAALEYIFEQEKNNERKREVIK
jgi:hypothetical protein